MAVGEAAQDAVWETQHPLTHHLAEEDPRRVQYLAEYQMSVGRQVLRAIENLRRGGSFDQRPRERRPAILPKADFASSPVQHAPAGPSSTGAGPRPREWCSSRRVGGGITGPSREPPWWTDQGSSREN